MAPHKGAVQRVFLDSCDHHHSLMNVVLPQAYFPSPNRILRRSNNSLLRMMFRNAHLPLSSSSAGSYLALLPNLAMPVFTMAPPWQYCGSPMAVIQCGSAMATACQCQGNCMAMLCLAPPWNCTGMAHPCRCHAAVLCHCTAIALPQFGPEHVFLVFK